MLSASKLRTIKEMGGRVTTVAELLGLSDSQVDIIDLELSLAEKLKAARIKAGVSQAALAKVLDTDQATIARMEQPTKTSIEALLRALRVFGFKPTIVLTRASKAESTMTPELPAKPTSKPRAVRSSKARARTARKAA